MPELIAAGKVFKAVPPLYGLETKKGTIYFTERTDYIKYVQKLFVNQNTVCYADGKNITSAELTKILYKNADYTYELLRIANRYAVDPELLETVLLLHLSKTNYQKMKSAIEKKYRFINVTKVNGVINISGSLNSKIQTLFYNDKIINECQRIINILTNNKYLSFIINGIPSNLFGLMSKFDEASPKNIRRFKGLGEMDGPSLKESTLDVNNRVLIQYTLEDAKRTIDEIRYFEDNKEKLLESDKEVTRFDVIG